MRTIIENRSRVPNVEILRTIADLMEKQTFEEKLIDTIFGRVFRFEGRGYTISMMPVVSRRGKYPRGEKSFLVEDEDEKKEEAGK